MTTVHQRQRDDLDNGIEIEGAVQVREGLASGDLKPRGAVRRSSRTETTKTLPRPVKSRSADRKSWRSVLEVNESLGGEAGGRVRPGVLGILPFVAAEDVEDRHRGAETIPGGGARDSASGPKLNAMQGLAERLVEDVTGWPDLKARDEDYGAVGWSLGRGTIGHVHVGSGVVDVLFTRAIRDQLLREHLAEKHRYQPNSGWVTWCLKNERDLDHARWLLRLSYLRRLARPTRHESDAAVVRDVSAEVSRLKLIDELRSLVNP
jgi:hypothetical protein